MSLGPVTDSDLSWVPLSQLRFDGSIDSAADGTIALWVRSVQIDASRGEEITHSLARSLRSAPLRCAPFRSATLHSTRPRSAARRSARGLVREWESGDVLTRSHASICANSTQSASIQPVYISPVFFFDFGRFRPRSTPQSEFFPATL